MLLLCKHKERSNYINNIMDDLLEGNRVPYRPRCILRLITEEFMNIKVCGFEAGEI